MKIEGSVQELELFFKKFEVKDKPTELKSGDFPLHTMGNKPPSELPSHKFPLLNPQEY